MVPIRSFATMANPLGQVKSAPPPPPENADELTKLLWEFESGTAVTEAERRCRVIGSAELKRLTDALVRACSAGDDAEVDRLLSLNAMPWSHEDLRRTQEHIEQALQYIAMQERRIEEMQREGRDTGNAEELLGALRQTLILLVQGKTAIERDLK